MDLRLFLIFITPKIQASNCVSFLQIRPIRADFYCGREREMQKSKCKDQKVLRSRKKVARRVKKKVRGLYLLNRLRRPRYGFFAPEAVLLLGSCLRDDGLEVLSFFGPGGVDLT